MAHAPHPTDSHLPDELIHRHKEGWHAFTKATKIACGSLAVFLLLMLLFWSLY